MWIFPLLAAAVVTTAPAPAITLPPAIKATLNEEYPGWKLAPVSKAVQAEFSRRKSGKLPSLVTADFNRDKKVDYAVQIVLTAIGQEEQIVMIFLAQPDGSYTESIVQSMGIDPNSYLWVQIKPMSTTGSDAQERMENITLLRVLGGPGGDAAYAFDTDHFTEVPLKANTDTSDSTVPHIEAAATPDGA